MINSIKKVLFISILVYIIILVSSLFIGRYSVNIINIICNNATNLSLEKNIILNLRLSRAIIATLTGISLSLSGLIYQETFQNDLVSPDLLGVTSGAGVGASIAIVLSLSSYFIVFFSFVFGILTVLFTVLISNVFRNKNNITLILSGIIVGSFMSSVLTTIKYFVNPETQLSTIVYWLMGSFANVTYNSILFTFPIVFILFIVLLLISHRINVIALGREETETKGVNYTLYRNIIIVVATILTATIVSCCGTISWIGLIIPHIVKGVVGRDVNKTIPLCAVFGAIFTLLADILSRTLAQSEIPISAITGFFGSIIFTIIIVHYSRTSFNYNYKRMNIDSEDINTSLLVDQNLQVCISDDNKIISIKNISFKYNYKQDYVLNNITLDIYDRDVVLVYGSNGSGKTTLLKVVSGILFPTAGKVLLNVNANFTDLHSMNILKRSKMISYVKQNFSNVTSILVRDYLILGMVNELRFYEKPTKDQIDRVYLYADSLNITRLLDKKISEISGGERQLVVICQSLLQNTNIMFLDEPTSSLDSDNEALVIETLNKLAKEYNKTMIIATHNSRFRDISGCRIIRLQDGSMY